VRIVGVDEAGASAEDISWVSPVAKALLRARVGDTVKIATPAGPKTIKVTEIAYPD
jgi:transcription elongation factor GreB